MHGGSAIANPWSPGSALFASSAASNAPSAVFKNGASGNTAPTVYLEAIANQTTDLIRTVGTGTGASGSGWDSAGHIYFSGDLQSQSARMTMGASTEAITLSTIGTTTDSTANLLPANSVIRGITVFVDESITVASAFSVGDATIAARFLATGTGLVFGSTAVGLACVDQTGTSGPKQTAAAKVRITTTGTPTAGIVRVTVFYETFRAPLS